MDGATSGPIRDPWESRRSAGRLSAVAALLRDRCDDVVAEWEQLAEGRRLRLDEAARVVERIADVAESLASGERPPEDGHGP